LAKIRVIDSLTTVRFFAAVWVVALHTGVHHRESLNSFCRNILGAGYVGVSFFFLLSGFILAYNYLGTISPGGRGRFWIARFARIYPVYFAGLLLSLPFFALAIVRNYSGQRFWDIVAIPIVLMLLQSLLPQTATAWNFPSWSLSVEAFFYAAFPWILDRISRGWSRLLVLVLYLYPIAFSLLYLWLRGDGLFNTTADSQSMWLYVVKFNPLIHLGTFVIGAVVGVEFRRGFRVSYPATIALLSAVAVVVLTGVGRIPYLFLHSGLLLPLFGSLILALACGGSVARILSAAPLVALGEASYSLYILHVPIHRFFLLGAKVFRPALIGSLRFEFLYVLAAIAISVVSHRFIEVPARRAVLDYVKRRSDRATALPKQACEAVEASSTPV
jgi:peptidoglycan/LPS O-acetylase OafA/YrhL